MFESNFFSQYEELNAAEEPGELELAHVDILSECLSLLLSATLGAFTFDAAANGCTVCAVELRHDWDAMLYRFCVTIDKRISFCVL